MTVPRLLFADADRLLLGLDFIDGQPLQRARYAQAALAPAQRDHLLAELAQLHRWRPDPQLRSSSAVLVATYQARMTNYAQGGFLSGSDREALTALLNRGQWRPQFNHGDLLLSNCLATAHGLAFIDWEYAGDYLPSYDLALLWILLAADVPTRAAIVAMVQRDEPTAEYAFLINQALLLAREQKIHQQLPSTPECRARLAQLDTDMQHIRQRLHSRKKA